MKEKITINGHIHTIFPTHPQAQMYVKIELTPSELISQLREQGWEVDEYDGVTEKEAYCIWRPKDSLKAKE